MMRKLLPLTAVALGLLSGVALADHRGGDHRVVVENRGVVRDHRWNGGTVVRGGGDWHRGAVVRDGGWRGGWHGGARVVIHDRPYYRNVVRRPIYVSRPIIRAHYYNYYRRPSLIVENYAPVAGYYWVAGHWYWSGYEWLWQAGYFQPDANYVDPAYSDGYYDNY
jgi:hypothetical protein